MNLSVIICTHNPRPEHLSRTLEALRGQTLPMTEWELLLIDNASRRATADSVDLTWHPIARNIREEVLGLTAARLRGIQEAKGQLLVFVDDDGVLEGSYLEIALGVGESRPELGCWGAGRIEPEYEKHPPEWLANHDGALSIRRDDRDFWANIPGLNPALPYGIGMCVRRTVAEQYASFCKRDKVRLSLDRSGESLACCGDTDIAMLSCALGLGTACFTALKITHLIPERRTTPDYISRALEAKAESLFILSSVYQVYTPSIRLLGKLKVKYLFYWIRYMTSGFSVHFRLALSLTRGELQGYKRMKSQHALSSSLLTNNSANQ